ncbi:unnamed protein product [Danaus chrysippus]|uniref:(African queen) hypothetical protein n=1 Tax=Danaus chrysippus TaxID=151541 RepID=A0A8J2W978_9NEOP|nr:unnamed protein product [Danaus chrysippus]
MTTLTPVSNKNEINCWENQPFTTVWPESEQYKPSRDSHVTRTIKKRKRNRTAYTTEQLRMLERTFSRSKYIDAERRKELAECLNIGEKCVKVWFQNRRMKEKKESSLSSDSSSESCATESISPPPESTSGTESEYNCPAFNHNPTQQIPHYGYYQQNLASESQIPYYPQGTSYTHYLPSFTSDFFRNDSNIYPTQYYPYTAPEYNYTNIEQVDQKQETGNNWSDTAFELNFL